MAGRVDTVERFELITQDSNTDPPEEPASSPLRIWDTNTSKKYGEIIVLWRNNMGL